MEELQDRKLFGALAFSKTMICQGRPYLKAVEIASNYYKKDPALIDLYLEDFLHEKPKGKTYLAVQEAGKLIREGNDAWWAIVSSAEEFGCSASDVGFYLGKRGRDKKRRNKKKGS